MTSAIVSGSGRKGRKRSRPAAPSFGWKPVEVTIGDVVPTGTADVTSDNGDAMAANHYDDDSFAHRASRDLEAEPGEGVGMFYGLEVISGDQYRMITTPHSEGSDPSSITRLLVVNSPDVTTNDVDKNVQTVRKQETPARNKSKKTKKQGDTASQNPNCAPSETRSTEPSATAGRTVETCKHSKSGPVDLTTARNGKISSKALEDDQQSDTGRSVAEGSQGRQRSQQQAQAMQDAWLMQTGGVSLDLAICEALVLQSFWTPTPIQAATLPAAILGRRNVVGAAPTGSGKTLAFLLPVAQFLLQKQESMHINDEATKDDSLQALIVTPTRELALQIHREAVALLSSSIKKNSGCGVLVGGLAHAKQSRVLASRPPILVATPGRLWELLSSGEHAHLNDLSRVRFLIIDEADRMIQQGSFPQLARILDAVQKANPTDDDDEEELGEEGTDITEEDGDTNRLFGLPGIPGEAKVTMLNASILQQIEEVKNGSKSGPPVVEEICSGEEDVDAEGFEGGSDDGSDPISLPGLPPVYRQTFVYSATLTLPSSGSALQSKKKKRARSNKDVDGAIAEILEKSRAKGTTKVVDLSHLDKRDKAKSVPITAQTDDRPKANAIPAGPAGQFRLPPGLTLQQIKCTQRHKDSHLYAYLLTTDAGASGPSLVFCNSIAAVRRVGATMQTLGLQVRVLHAQMQQRARFKAIESLRNGKERTVVVCTDVAARGLDIPSVASVVHYDVARTVDSFVHRSGRTARGMGPGAVGSSLSLVAPSEDRIHGKIVESLQAKFESVNLDGRLFKAAQERVNLACKVVETEETERKTQQSNKWFLDNAEEAGIELDEDVFEEGLAGGDKRDRGRLREGQLAKERLQKLLAEPMQTQRFCKFLSTRTASNHRSIAPSLPQAGGNQARRNKKRRRN